MRRVLSIGRFVGKVPKSKGLEVHGCPGLGVHHVAQGYLNVATFPSLEIKNLLNAHAMEFHRDHMYTGIINLIFGSLGSLCIEPGVSKDSRSLIE